MTNEECRLIHALTDVETELHEARRTMADLGRLLRDAQHAHEHGRTAIVTEYLERSATACERLSKNA